MNLETAVFDGVTMRYRKDSRDHYIIRRVISENIYGVPDSLAGKVVIDVGAHIGSFSALAASRGAKVHAFEPEQCNFSILRQNVAAYGSVWCVWTAIGAGPRAQHLWVHATNSGCHSLLRSDLQGSAADFQLCSVSTPEEMFQQADGRCDFLKLDCEGGEEAILPWMLKTTIRPEQISAEFHSRPFLAWALAELAKDYSIEGVQDGKEMSQWEFRFHRKK